MKKILLPLLALCTIAIPAYLLIKDRSNFIGYDLDEFGCNITTGYSYKKEVDACAPSWLDEEEIKLYTIAVQKVRESEQNKVINIGKKVIYVNKIEALKCPGCYSVFLQIPKGEQILKVSIINWEASTVEKVPILPVKPQEDTSKYQCPETKWIDCMPIIDGSKKSQCETKYLEWVKQNCSEFEGVAY